MYAGGGTGGVGVLVFEFLCFKLDARHMEGACSDAILRALRVESYILTPPNRSSRRWALRRPKYIVSIQK